MTCRLPSLAAALAAVLACVLGAAGCPPRSSPSTAHAFTPADREAYLASFDHVFTTIRDKHWDPDLGGLDWDAVGEELRPKMEVADSRAGARAILADLVKRVGLTHYAILSGDAAEAIEASGDDGGGGHVRSHAAGVDVRVIDGRGVVTRVEEGSDAAAKGVRPGWVVVAVDGVSLGPGLESLALEYAGSTLRDDALASAVLARLDGPAGSSCRADFIDGADRTIALEIERARPRGEPTTFGHFPTTYVWIEARDLADGQVGYLAFNYFLDPLRLMKAFEEAVARFGKRRGIVVDLRGNPGGIGGMAMGMAGWFVDRPGLELGTMHMRDSTLRFFVNPRQGHYPGPLAILVDGLSASTSEIFAGGLKDIGRARLFGSPTAGAALPSVVERLPTGEIFQYAIADYISTGGAHLEGEGVEPHVQVAPAREDLLAGRDPALEAAVAWILERE